MRRYRFLAVTAPYWKPGVDFVADLVGRLEGKVQDGDVVVVSEKAVSTAMGNIVDENVVESGLASRLLAKYWMRYVWGYLLGPLCRLREATIHHLRNYPDREGGSHKQLALRYCGLLQALMHGSEGGIDGSNLPYCYVSLPLNDAYKIAERIHNDVEVKLGKSVVVMIVDTDKTYSWRSFHFTPRPKPIEGILSWGGVVAYVLGRFFRLKKRATPLAVAGARLVVEEALDIAELSNRARGFGAGRTVWDMAKTFQVQLTGVSWEMLEQTRHKPIVIVRRFT